MTGQLAVTLIDLKALKTYKTVLASRGIWAGANFFSQLCCAQPHSRCSGRSETNWRWGGGWRSECRQLWLMWWDVLTPCYKELKNRAVASIWSTQDHQGRL